MSLQFVPAADCPLCGNHFRTHAYVYGVCDKCAKRAIDRALAEADKCIHCDYPPDHFLHKPATECDSCEAPLEHHIYQRKGSV
jgi:hypothetical protein